MFTGIIEGLGKIVQIIHRGKEIMLRIQPLFAIDKYQQGESISVNGICLTVTNFGKDWFEAYVSPESLAITNLAHLKFNDLVNLERALIVGDRLGGHFVTGHIDTIATLTTVEPNSNSKKMVLAIDKKYSELLVEKGSITIDGVSLTINARGADFFAVNVIPETLQNTIISRWKVGYRANVEIDLISKHVKQLIIGEKT